MINIWEYSVPYIQRVHELINFMRGSTMSDPRKHDTWRILKDNNGNFSGVSTGICTMVGQMIPSKPHARLASCQICHHLPTYRHAVIG